MRYQSTFSDVEYLNRKRISKREEFLDSMNEIVPWDRWIGLIKPFYPNGKRGRPTRGIETMLRMYLLQIWFNLSDEGIEDAIYDSYCMRKFMGLDFLTESVPDATTLLKFRHLLEKHGLGKIIFEDVKEALDKQGLIMHGGTIVDATLIAAPSSTKNEKGERDPEMHQTKKGNQWYFGAKLHVGVDAGSGYIHTIDVTAANVHDAEVATKLIREDDHVVYGDSAYCAVGKHEDVVNDPNMSKIDFRTNRQKPYRKNRWEEGPGLFWLRALEYDKSRVRSKVEYVFHIVKNIFHFRKTRYRGLAKLKTKLDILCACVNYYMYAMARIAEEKLESLTALRFET